MKLDSSKIDLTNTNQKIFAGVLLAIVLGVLYYLLPPFIVILKNLWIAAILAIPIIFVVMNPMLIWNIFKQLSWSLTKTMISGDKLGYMYRYHDYLISKINDLNKNIQNVGAIRVKLRRKIGDLSLTIKENKSKALAFQDKQAPATVIRTLGNKIAIDTKQMEALMPKVLNVEKQEAYLKELYDNWVSGAEDLKYTLDAKAQEYELLKEVNSATDNASSFLKGNNEEYKLYQESLKQIETSVTQYTANIEDFERRVQPILQNLSMERSVSEDEGLKLIEDFKKSTVSLKLPEGS